MYVSQAAFSFCEQQIIRVTPSSWSVTDHFFFLKDLWEFCHSKLYYNFSSLYGSIFSVPGNHGDQSNSPQAQDSQQFFSEPQGIKKRNLKPTEETKYNIAISRLFLTGQGGLVAA